MKFTQCRNRRTIKMPATRGRWTIHIITIVIMKVVVSYGISSNCSVPLVGMGQKSNVACHFSADLGMSNNTVKITRYTHTAEGLQDTTVLLCHLSAKRPKCQTHAGYIFEGTITDKLSLEISHADEEHIGVYECHVFYSDSGDKSCKFELKDHYTKTSSPVSVSEITESLGISSNCSVPLVGMGQKTNVTCHFSADVGMSNNTVKITRYTDTAEGLQDTTVLLCHLSAKRPNCQTHAGYIFEGTITDKLSLEIYHANEEHIGAYECHVFYSDSGDKSCKFELKDYDFKKSSPVSVTEITEPLVHNKHGMDMRFILVGVLISLLVIAVFAVGLMFALYYTRIEQYLPLKHQRNRRKQERINTRKLTSQECSPLDEI